MGSGSSKTKKAKAKLKAAISVSSATVVAVQPTVEDLEKNEAAEPICGDDIHRPVLDKDEIDLRGVSVAFLRDFKEKIISKREWIEKQSDAQGFGLNCSSAAVCANLCAKETEELKVAYIDLFTKKREGGTSDGTPYIGDANVFVSHAWKYDCVEVIGSIIESAEKIQEDTGSAAPLYFWFDICTVCQHETGVVRTQEWWANTFKASIAKIGYTLLILMPWDNPTPMTRAWCLWEMLATLSSGTTLRCQMPKVEREKFNTSMEEDPVAVSNAMKVFEMIDARNAEAWVEADRLMIFNAVEASPGGFHDLNGAIKDQMREWVVDTAKMQEVDLRTEKDTKDIDYARVNANDYKAPDKAHKVGMLETERANVTEQLTRLQFNLGHLLNSLRRHDQAEEVLARCMSTAKVEWDKAEKHLDLAGLYRVLGQAAAGRADYAAAQSYYMEAVKVHKQYGDIRGHGEPAMRQVAELMMNLGQTAKSMDQLDQALQFFNQSFEYLTTLQAMGDEDYEELHKLAKPTIADGGGDDDGIAAPARPKTAGPLSRQEKEERTAKRISQLRLLQADVKVNLGAVYTSLAGKYTTDANRSGHDGDQEQAAAMATKATATLAESKSAYLTAETCYREEHGESNFKYARVAVYLGNLAKKEGVTCMRARNRTGGEAAFDEAANYYQRALVIHEQVVGRDHLDTAGILFSMGNVLAMRQKIAEARGKFTRALEIYKGRGMGQHPQAKMVEAAMKSLQNK